MTQIKICGITNAQDAINASRLNVDMLGFVFYKKSKRYVESKAAGEIVKKLPPSIKKVGVFVDEKPGRVRAIAEELSLDMLQFHGDETPKYCDSFEDRYKVIKAFRIRDKKDLSKINDYDTDFYLLDTYEERSAGGTGKAFDWKILKDFEILQPIILAGGLTPKNVAGAIEELSPYGVDVSTGVETRPGEKDLRLMKEFINNARKLDR